jgi:hypothetical protein
MFANRKTERYDNSSAPTLEVQQRRDRHSCRRPWDCPPCRCLRAALTVAPILTLVRKRPRDGYVRGGTGGGGRGEWLREIRKVLENIIMLERDSQEE